MTHSYNPTLIAAGASVSWLFHIHNLVQFGNESSVRMKLFRDFNPLVRGRKVGGWSASSVDGAPRGLSSVKSCPSSMCPGPLSTDGWSPLSSNLLYGLQLVTREVHRSSLRGMMSPARDAHALGPIHVSHIADYVYVYYFCPPPPLSLSLTQMLVLLYLHATVSILHMVTGKW